MGSTEARNGPYFCFSVSLSNLFRAIIIHRALDATKQYLSSLFPPSRGIFVHFLLSCVTAHLVISAHYFPNPLSLFSLYHCTRLICSAMRMPRRAHLFLPFRLIDATLSSLCGAFVRYFSFYILSHKYLLAPLLDAFFVLLAFAAACGNGWKARRPDPVGAAFHSSTSRLVLGVSPMGKRLCGGSRKKALFRWFDGKKKKEKHERSDGTKFTEAKIRTRME